RRASQAMSRPSRLAAKPEFTGLCRARQHRRRPLHLKSTDPTRRAVKIETFLKPSRSTAMALQRRTTLTKYLIEQQRETNNLPADLRLLIEVVARACKAISYHVSKGALGDALGTAGSENVQGEVQKKLDILSNEILLEANEWGGNLAGMASEEMEQFF